MLGKTVAKLVASEIVMLVLRHRDSVDNPVRKEIMRVRESSALTENEQERLVVLTIALHQFYLTFYGALNDLLAAFGPCKEIFAKYSEPGDMCIDELLQLAAKQEEEKK